MIVVTHNESVVEELLNLLVGAQVEHERRHGGAQRSKAPWDGVRCIWEKRVARRHVAVVDHKISVVNDTIRGSYAGGAAVPMQDLIHFAIRMNRSAHLFNDLAERFNNAVDATLGVPDAIGDL